MGQGIADNAGDVARGLSNWVHEKVYIGADGVPEKIGIRFYGISSRDPADRKLVIQHFEQQTGLTATEETRTVRHLFIEKTTR